MQAKQRGGGSALTAKKIIEMYLAPFLLKEINNES